MEWVLKGRNLFEGYNNDGRFTLALIVDFEKLFAYGASVSLVRLQ